MLFDTDILIWTLRGNAKAAEAIEGERVREVSILSHLELMQGARDKRELVAIRRFLLDFETVPLSEEIGYRARVYMEDHSLKSALGVVDALVAATAVEHQTPLCTANLKHYRPIKDLELKAFRP
jgi:predicted nucleic acid-binding protein